MIRQAFQIDLTVYLTTTEAAALTRYYEHTFGVTVIFRAFREFKREEEVIDDLFVYLLKLRNLEILKEVI